MIFGREINHDLDTGRNEQLYGHSARRTDPRNGLHGTYCDCLCRGEGEKPL